jgi:hypothetical protein
MKTAKATPAAWYIDCSNCGEGLPDQDGSLMWSEPGAIGKTTQKCDACGVTNRLPACVSGRAA